LVESPRSPDPRQHYFWSEAEPLGLGARARFLSGKSLIKYQTQKIYENWKNTIKFKTYQKTKRGLEVSDAQLNPFIFIRNKRHVISSEVYPVHPFGCNSPLQI